MEHIKDILIMCACVSFVVYVFFAANYNGGVGVFENAGNIYAPMMEDEEVVHDGLDYIGEEVNSYVPEIKYNSGAKQVGDCVAFKELFLVRTEEDYALYLIDIKNQSGNSVLECLSSEDLEDMDEIPAPFVYDKEKDLLYIFGSGIYTVEIKVYGSNGEVGCYEFNLPVEVS